MCNFCTTYLQHIKHNMSLFDRFIGVLAPHDCLGCGDEGELLCASCSTKLVVVPERCYRCRKFSSAGRTCGACRRISRLEHVHVALVYDGLAKDLVWHLKFKGAVAAAKTITQYTAPLMPKSAGARIVPVPTATGRVRRRGYDQAKLLARELARQSRLPYVDCLARSGQAHQVGASRQERLRQLREAFRVSRPATVRGRHVILVDDVVTTGATLEAAATALKSAGARHIEAVVFAQP